MHQSTELYDPASGTWELDSAPMMPRAAYGFGTVQIDDDPDDPFVCGDSDADSCDDCDVMGSYTPDDDGLDSDGDGQCDAGDGDVDHQRRQGDERVIGRCGPGSRSAKLAPWQRSGEGSVSFPAAVAPLERVDARQRLTEDQRVDEFCPALALGLRHQFPLSMPAGTAASVPSRTSRTADRT